MIPEEREREEGGAEEGVTVLDEMAGWEYLEESEDEEDRNDWEMGSGVGGEESLPSAKYVLRWANGCEEEGRGAQGEEEVGPWVLESAKELFRIVVANQHLLSCPLLFKGKNSGGSGEYGENWDISTKEPNISAKEPDMSPKEPCISANEPCISEGGMVECGEAGVAASEGVVHLSVLTAGLLRLGYLQVSVCVHVCVCAWAR